jgi:hypothetical protein
MPVAGRRSLVVGMRYHQTEAAELPGTESIPAAVAKTGWLAAAEVDCTHGIRQAVQMDSTDCPVSTGRMCWAGLAARQLQIQPVVHMPAVAFDFYTVKNEKRLPC